MSNGKQSSSTSSGGAWTPTQAYIMAVVCLLIGIAVGYLLRGSSTSSGSSASVADATAPSGMTPGMPAGSTGQVTPAQLKHMADKQAEPLLAQLKTNPNDTALLAQIGNTYYDAQQFQDAISYYERALKFQPANTDVRTDMGTAYWYLGDADRAVAEFRTVLKADPNKANTLFNLGMVQWQGKMDADGAVATWQKLLATNPSYENRQKVEEMIAQAKKHSGVKPGTKTDKPAM
jgi:cytochrome c-type biogenesis protein CcmH/NrfG